MNAHFSLGLLSAFVIIATTSITAGSEANRDISPELTAVSSAVALARPPAIEDLYAIFRLQDAASTGQKDSIELQKRLILDAGPNITAFVSGATRDQLQYFGPDIAAYVLSGGSYLIASALGQDDRLNSTLKNILLASSDFMQGNRQAAQNRLKNVDMNSLPSRLSGRIALVHSILTDNDRDAKQAWLAFAASAMPGSLIEESALRRSALTYAESGDEQRFWERVARYQRRYRNSLYARGFWRDVLQSLIIWSTKVPTLQLTRLDAHWTDLPRSDRQDLYLEFARQAAARNAPQVAEFAAARLLRISMDRSRESQIALLYMSIYKISSPNSEEARLTLRQINRSFLAPQEDAFLAAALTLSNQINRALPMAHLSVAVEDRRIDELQARSEALLAGSDDMLRGARHD